MEVFLAGFLGAPLLALTAAFHLPERAFQRLARRVRKIERDPPGET